MVFAGRKYKHFYKIWITFNKNINLHKVSEDQDWNKPTKELIRDYIPLVILIGMVILGLALIIIT